MFSVYTLRRCNGGQNCCDSEMAAEVDSIKLMTVENGVKPAMLNNRTGFWPVMCVNHGQLFQSSIQQLKRKINRKCLQIVGTIQVSRVASSPSSGQDFHHITGRVNNSYCHLIPLFAELLVVHKNRLIRPHHCCVPCHVSFDCWHPPPIYNHTVWQHYDTAVMVFVHKQRQRRGESLLQPYCTISV